MSDVFLASRLQTAMGDAYRLERELPGGGMSRLFVALESSLNRRVVIKVLPPELTSEVSAARFKQEIELAAHLQHPNILPILAAGSKDDLLYYVMPYVAGESLRHHIEKSGPMPVSDAVRILREVADALAHAHRKGIVHRDIKPENILLEEGHAVLADFGVARAIDEARSGAPLPRVTGTGMSVGTPTYMAPEQASGDRHIDARADLYALAIVGYEMLAGKVPFSAPSAQAIVAAHLTQPPAPITKSRPDVPTPLATAIQKALAKSPEERYRTAEEFRDAIDPAATAGGGGGGGRRRWIVIGIAAAIVIAGGALLATWKSRPKLDDHALAVAPFDVLDPELKLWHEGMVDVLSRNLDGAGEMRSIAPSVVIKHWAGRADRASAAELGLATGARYAVIGSLLSAGDSVIAKASVLDVRTGRTVGDEIERKDVPARIDRLSDSLTFALVRVLSHTSDLGAQRLSALGTSSLPALKAYLLGEQYYRRSEWDSASAEYKRAVDIDTTFAIADHALGDTYGWIGGSGDTLSNFHFARAGRHNRGLAPRDSLIIGAEALVVRITSGFDARDLQDRQQMFRMLDEASRRYPDDPAVWYALGDARFHFGWGRVVGVPIEMVMQPFDRSIAADSSYLPAYVHAIALAYAIGGEHAGRHYAERYLAQHPTGMDAEGVALALPLTDPARAHTAATQQALDAASNDVLLRAQNAVYAFGDSGEAVVRAVSALSPTKTSIAPRYSDPKWQSRRLGSVLMTRGHYAEGSAKIDNITFQEVVGVLLGSVSADSAMAMYERDRRNANPQCPPCWLNYFAGRRDTTAIHVMDRAVDSTMRAMKGMPMSAEPYIKQEIQAYLMLARGDSAGALHALETLPDSLCYSCGTSEITQAQLLEAAHRDRDALKLVSIAGSGMDYYSMMLTLERARIAERLGEKEIAVDGYSRIAGYWQNGDAFLQPYVKESRAALARLGGEHAKGIPIAGMPASR